MQFLERRADHPVEIAAARVQEAAIGRLVHEPVAEAVLGGRPAALFDDEVEPLELRERWAQSLRRHELLQQAAPNVRPTTEASAATSRVSGASRARRAWSTS